MFQQITQGFMQFWFNLGYILGEILRAIGWF
jgi:hypothetical protein